MFSSHTKMFPSGSDYRDTSLSAVPPHNSQNQTFICDRTNDFRSCSSGHVFNDSKRSFTRDVLPSYVTQQSDSGFGSALSSGSSCSYLPPPPPYRMRIKQHKIYRSSSDSKYFTGQQSIISLFTDVHRVKGGERWNSQCSLVSYYHSPDRIHFFNVSLLTHAIFMLHVLF
ncbi:hypothetical protein DICVIV_10746 [Dictyocaulus viviparus]|uniref:Uncharacterized protein n=1 Tax=Dictyocaulus viviparus TaxID=29172 RepID=A0A0D8XF24_DICVI|nr:hypothetical protein DICVIV_10746 [Dictyocaulus viviparus]